MWWFWIVAMSNLQWKQEVCPSKQLYGKICCVEMQQLWWISPSQMWCMLNTFNAMKIIIYCSIFLILQMQVQLKHLKTFPLNITYTFMKIVQLMIIFWKITGKRRLEFILKTWYEMQTYIRIEEVEHENCVNINFNYVSDQRFSLISLLSMSYAILSQWYICGKLLTPDDNLWICANYQVCSYQMILN